MERRRPISKNRSRSGQAMAEFLVGLAGVMLLVVGLQQISILSARSFEAHSNVRKSLAEQMMDPMSDYTEGFVFATKTDPGRDGKNYTGDDRLVAGNSDFFEKGQGFLDKVNHDSLVGYLPDNPYDALTESGLTDLSKSFEMLYAEDRKSVEVVPFLRRVLERGSVNLERHVWMPELGGLLE